MFTFKISAFAVAAAFWFIIWQLRQARAKKRLQELDEGKRCVSCDGTELQPEAAGVVRCLRCGYEASLDKLRAAVVSADEIADVTKPPQERGL
jgi:ribosomal protein L37AE/L43A